MSWRRSRASIVIRDTSSRESSGYQRDIRELKRQSAFGKSIRKSILVETKPVVSPVQKEPKPRGIKHCGFVFRKIQNNRPFRIRVTYSLCLLWVYMLLGWNTGQIGPILLDLALITGVNLEVASTYIIITGIGYILGSFFGGLVYERISRPLALCIATLSLAVMEISIPYCRSYWAMMVVLLLDSIAEGLIDTVANTEMVSLWGRSVESWMQGMYFMFAVGAVMSPLVTAPFLAPATGNAINGEITLSRYNVEESRIHLVYIINAVLAVIATGLLIYQCLVNSRYLHGLSLPINDEHPSRRLSTKHKLLILLNMGLLCLVYTAMEETFAEYLTTFCVSQMGMTKIQGAEATSLFYAAFGVSRFLGILLVTQINPVSLVLVYLIILVLSFTGLALSGAYVIHVGIWLFTPMVGVGMSIVYPILYTWTDEQFVPISGKIAAYLVISASIGGIINPAVLGHLMDFVNPMWYCYILLGEAALFLVLYDFGLILSMWVTTKAKCQRLYDSEVEMDAIQKDFGLDQRYDPSIGSFDRTSPPPGDNTGMQATVRLSDTRSTKSKQSGKSKMDTISEDKPGTLGLSEPERTSPEKETTSSDNEQTVVPEEMQKTAPDNGEITIQDQTQSSLRKPDDQKIHETQPQNDVPLQTDTTSLGSSNVEPKSDDSNESSKIDQTELESKLEGTPMEERTPDSDSENIDPSSSGGQILATKHNYLDT